MRSVLRSFLRHLAYSPLSYCLAAFFVLFVALQFFVGQRFFSAAGSTDMHRFFAAMPVACIFVVPAAAALLPSTTADCLLPVSSWSVVAARLSALSLLFLCCVLLTVPVPCAVARFGDLDVPALVCGYAGILFYGVSALALALFICILLAQGAAAFFVTVLLLVLGTNAHLVALHARLPAWCIACCKALSVAWHFDAAGKGIIDSRDCLFYCAVTVLFCLAAVGIMEWRRGERDRRYWRLFSLMCVAGLLVWVDSARLYVRVDVSREKRFTVSPFSKALLQEVEAPLAISYYRSSRLRQLYPQVRDVEDFLQAYAGQGRWLSYTAIDPAQADMAARLEELGVRGQQMQSDGRDGVSYSTVYSAIALSYLDRTEIIPFVLDTKTLEYELSSRVQYMVRGTQRIVQIVMGNDRPLEDYGSVQPWLEGQGFQVIRTYLPSERWQGKSDLFTLYADIPLVLIGSSRLTREDAEALDFVIQRGGRVFMATTPYAIAVDGDWAIEEGDSFIADELAYTMQKYGVYMSDGPLADSSCFSLTLARSQTATESPASAPHTVNVDYALWPVLRAQPLVPEGMTLFWPCALSLDAAVAADSGFVPKPLLYSSSASWLLERDGGMFVTNPFAVTKGESETDSFVVAASLSKKGEDRESVVVLGDQYALSSQFIAYSSSDSGVPDVRGLAFVSDSLLRLCGEGAIVSLKRGTSLNTSLYKPAKEDFVPLVRWTLFCTCLMPLLLIVAFGLGCAIARNTFNKEAL